MNKPLPFPAGGSMPSLPGESILWKVIPCVCHRRLSSGQSAPRRLSFCVSITDVLSGRDRFCLECLPYGVEI